MAVCLVAVLGVFLYVKLRFGQVNKLALNLPLPGDGQPFNVLVVGSDSRASMSASQAVHYGSASQVQGQRSDVTMILHVDPSSQQASILSIPRDLFVPIAGTGGSNRINSAFDSGPTRLIQTIQQDLGIQINHYAQVDFNGFQGIVNAVGGIEVNFPYPARDSYSGLNITQPGCNHLDGAAALAMARSRDYEYLANGRWQYDGTGDLGRIQREHTFLRILMQKAISAGIRNPITANSIVSSAVHDVTIDNGLSPGDLVRLVLAFKSLQPSSVATYTIPTIPVNNYQGFGDVLFAQQPQATQVVAQFLSTSSSSKSSGPSGSSPQPTVKPSNVTVQVLNGTGAAGQAGKAADELRSAGFQVAGTGNSTSFSHPQSVVLYAPGQQAAAQLLQSQVAGGAQVQEDSALKGIDVELVTGTSFTGIHAASAPTAPAAPGPAPSPYPPYDPRAC